MVVALVALTEACLSITCVASSLCLADLTVAAHTRLVCTVTNPAESLALAHLTLFTIESVLTGAECLVLVGFTMDRVVL
jgi:hypothetical protein